jgi:hypothetical protein
VPGEKTCLREDDNDYTWRIRGSRFTFFEVAAQAFSQFFVADEAVALGLPVVLGHAYDGMGWMDSWTHRIDRTATFDCVKKRVFKLLNLELSHFFDNEKKVFSLSSSLRQIYHQVYHKVYYSVKYACERTGTIVDM